LILNYAYRVAALAIIDAVVPAAARSWSYDRLLSSWPSPLQVGGPNCRAVSLPADGAVGSPVAAAASVCSCTAGLLYQVANGPGDALGALGVTRGGYRLRQAVQRERLPGRVADGPGDGLGLGEEAPGAAGITGGGYPPGNVRQRTRLLRRVADGPGDALGAVRVTHGGYRMC
jgi:hypothetical protein